MFDSASEGESGSSVFDSAEEEAEESGSDEEEVSSVGPCVLDHRGCGPAAGTG